jgi:hypothetical protein
VIEKIGLATVIIDVAMTDNIARAHSGPNVQGAHGFSV